MLVEVLAKPLCHEPTVLSPTAPAVQIRVCPPSRFHTPRSDARYAACVGRPSVPAASPRRVREWAAASALRIHTASDPDLATERTHPTRPPLRLGRGCFGS